MKDASKQSPASPQTAIDLEIYLGALVTENIRLMELDRYKVSQVILATHNFRSSLTMFNLHLYMLEHVPPDTQTRYIGALKDGVADLAKQVEDLVIQVRQRDVPDDYDPNEYANLDDFTRPDSLSDPG